MESLTTRLVSRCGAFRFLTGASGKVYINFNSFRIRVCVSRHIVPECGNAEVQDDEHQNNTDNDTDKGPRSTSLSSRSRVIYDCFHSRVDKLSSKRQQLYVFRLLYFTII